MNFRDKFSQFMRGRYGMDSFSRFLMTVGIVCLLLSALFDIPFFNFACWALLIYLYFRMFSRNISKMYAQNQKFLNIRYKAVAKWNKTKNHMKQRKVYRFYKCPSCKQKVRVPKGKGRICITCPKCRTEFVKKS